MVIKVVIEESPNDNIIVTKEVEGVYKVELIFDASTDQNGVLIGSPYTLEQMIVTIYNIPGFEQIQTHLVDVIITDGKFVGYGGNDHDITVFEDEQLLERANDIIETDGMYMFPEIDGMYSGPSE